MNNLQLVLRNAVTQARQKCGLTNEHYDALMKQILMLSTQNFLVLRIGEDVASLTPEIQLVGDSLVNTGAAPGTITFQKAAYPVAQDLTEMVLDGVGDSDFRVKKEYAMANGSTPPPKWFASTQLPLHSDNFTLEVTLQPGASLKRAVLLFDLGL